MTAAPAAHKTTATNATRRRNLWPIAIITYFLIVIPAMVAWIVYASRQQNDLVRSDYYEKEVLFQQQIDAAQRAKLAVGVGVSYDFARQAIQVQLPAAHQQGNAAGTIHLYRPSDARLDRELPLTLGATGAQSLDATGLAPGLWKVRLSWRVNNQDFYFDQPIVVGSNT